jgi:hypothetical protein
MRNGERGQKEQRITPAPPEELLIKLPLPTAQYRRRAWLEFQRAIDPLAQPKPLRLRQH